MGILANVPAEQTENGGDTLMQQLDHFKPSQFNVVNSSNGYTGFVVHRFEKDLTGFNDALAFDNYYESHHLGKMDWNEASRRGKHIFGWLAKEEDYTSDNPVGRLLSESGELKTLSEMQLELSQKTESIINSFTNQINAKSKYLQEFECKYNQAHLALHWAMEDTDSLCQRYDEEIRIMQSAARENSRKICQENDQLRKELDEKESDLLRRSKQLNELVAHGKKAGE